MRFWKKIKGCDDLVLLGVVTGGAILAKRIASRIKDIEGIEIPCGSLDVTNYRDDRRPLLSEDQSDVPFYIEGKKVVLVDDVLFRGRTVRAAMDALMRLGRPEGNTAGCPDRSRTSTIADSSRLCR